MVALSGGKDSIVLLKVLHDITYKNPNINLIALTIDEGIEGYREQTIKSAESVCIELGIEHHISSMKDEFNWAMDEIMGESRGKIPACSYCGVLRRRLLNDKARELKATKIATGHNLDDEVQSFLMNIIRGDLARIARLGANVGVLKDKRFVPRIKPLRNSPEREVALYALLNGLSVGFDECPYSGGAFRVSVRDMINNLEDKHPGSKFQLLRTTDDLIKTMRATQSDGRLGTCERCGEPTSAKICKVCQMLDELSRRK